MKDKERKLILAFHKGAYAAIGEISSQIDELICESNHYKENEKLWKLRHKVLNLEKLVLENITKYDK